MYLTLVGIVIVAVACYLGRGIWHMSQRSSAVKRRAAEVFSGRALLTVDQFSELFPTDLRQVAGTIREILEGVLIVDVRCVRPQDRLIADLGLGHVDGLDAYHLDGDVESRYRLSILGLFESTGDPTVDDVVRYVAQRITTNQAVNPRGGSGRS